jgi:hypothetical protein
MEDKTGKNLRITGIVLMALTTAMNILGGTGTVCAAFLTKKYPMVDILRPVDYRWLYQTFMIVTILIGLAGIWTTINLIRGKNKAYQNTLIVLAVGTLVSGIHFYASMTIRGSATPANMKFFANVITFLVFLIFGLPGIRQRVNFSGPGDTATQMTSGGLAAIMVGILILSVRTWVGASHVYDGNNWVDVLRMPLLLSGSGLTITGVGLMLRSAFDSLNIFGREKKVTVSPD